ncbi:MAG: NAD(P)H-hydrate epimerase [Planctomycetes bacterium]|nr:NAD(P)H-hydrate epimerase [Planctomycetota bacterium]
MALPACLLAAAPGPCLAESFEDAGRGGPMQNAVMLAVVIFFILVVGVYALIIFVKRRPSTAYKEEEEAAGLAIPPEVLAKIPQTPAAPADALERHRRIVAMENCARDHACRIAQELGAGAPPEDGRAGPGAVWLLAGPGPLGAICMALARHLESLGVEATVQLLAFTDKLGPEAQAQRKTLLASKLKLIESPTPRHLKSVARIVAGADAELLTEARRADLKKIVAYAAEDGIALEQLDEFSAHYASPPPSADDLVIPASHETLSREDTRLIDSLAQQAYGVPGGALMENAGYWAAREAYFQAQALEKEKGAAAVVALCGRGNNGGDGFVVARHLLSWGYSSEVFLLGLKEKMTDDAGLNLRLLEEAGIKVTPVFDDSQWPLVEKALNAASLIIDAALGTGMHGQVRGQAVDAIRLMNAARAHGAFVLAIDCPSGIDCNTGAPLGACVQADLTVTFAANKQGFALGKGPELCGQIVIADIGLPREIYRRRTAAAG